MVCAVCCCDCFGGQEAGFDGGADFLAALGVGHAGCVADEEDSVVEDFAIASAVEQVGVAEEF